MVIIEGECVAKENVERNSIHYSRNTEIIKGDVLSYTGEYSEFQKKCIQSGYEQKSTDIIKLYKDDVLFLETNDVWFSIVFETFEQIRNSKIEELTK